MLTVFKDLLSSKKFVTGCIGVAATIAARYGFDLDQATTAEVVGLFATIIIGQGIQDHGSTSAAIVASTRTTTSVASTDAVTPTVVAVETKAVQP